MKQFYRGTGIHIEILFRDEGGSPVTPTSASATISFMPVNVPDCDRTHITYPLVKSTTPGDFTWSLDWDSSVSAPCVVDGTAATTDHPTSKVDFQFRLTANRANRELAGDDWLGYGY